MPENALFWWQNHARPDTARLTAIFVALDRRFMTGIPATQHASRRCQQRDFRKSPGRNPQITGKNGIKHPVTTQCRSYFMQRPFILPPALCRFIQSLEPPAPQPQPRADEWPEPDNPAQSQTLPPMYPQPRAWQVARDAFISHLMACPACVTHGVNVPRYCPEGIRLHQQYESTPYDTARTD